MNAAQVMTEAAIKIRNGMTGDFADFAIATPPIVDARKLYS
jgi:hypothetical protein